VKLEQTILNKLQDAKTYNSVSGNTLTLCDPITQICKRLEAFFKADDSITCRYMVNNHKVIGPKIDPETGKPFTKKITVEGEPYDAVLDEDHLCEFRIFVNDVEKAQCLSSVIRHRHTIPEIYEAASDGTYHLRNHYLIIHVCTLDAVDPDGSEGGANPWTIDDDTNKGVKEIYGLEPIDWNDLNTGCNDRLSPLDNSESDIPKGAPEEYEQAQWENDPVKIAWKWKWLKTALKGNKNVVTMYEVGDIFENTWRFIECSYMPVVFMEDNLTSSRGYNSVLPADMLPLLFPLFQKIQISTYVGK
jgi:hypothetical protein